jgi:TRAP transporter TAXI family solute receptor
MRITRPRAAVLVVLASGAFGACQSKGGSSAAPITRISIATGGTGGVYYVYGGAIAQAISKSLPGVEATAEVTTASVENLNFVAQGSADLGFTLADTAYDAVQGTGRFKSQLPIRTLAVLYMNATHIVVRGDSPVTTVPALKGKRVSVGSRNSGTEVIAERVLKAAGLDTSTDISREHLGVSESAAALKDGTIDAFFWSGGLPTAAVLELAAGPGSGIRLLSDAFVVDKLVKEFGVLYHVKAIPANLYPNTPGADVSGVWNLLVVNADMPNDLAYQITKVLFERKADLAAAHPTAKELDPKVASMGSPIPHHLGALRYYREVGAVAP